MSYRNVPFGPGVVTTKAPGGAALTVRADSSVHESDSNSDKH